jgi:hemin uptake protein HemP
VTQNPQKPVRAASLPEVARKPSAIVSSVDSREQSEVDSRQLFADANELFIRHDGERYTLRRTSKGKLILTK